MPFQVGASLLIIGLSSSSGAVTTGKGNPVELQTGDATAPAPPAATETVPNKPRVAAPAPLVPDEGSEASDEKQTDDSEQAEAAEGGAASGEGASAESPPPAAEGTASGADPGAVSAADAPAASAETSPSVAPATVAPATVAPSANDVVTTAAGVTAQPAADPNSPLPPPGSGFQVGLPTSAASAPGTDKGPTTPTPPANALPPGQIPVPGGMSIAIGTQMSFGQSTFQLGSSYARDPMVDWSISLSPSYFFGDGTRIAASASLSQEITDANGDDEPGTVIFSDVGLTASRPLYRFEKGPNLFGALSVQLPTSTASRVETLVMSAGARVSAAQPVGPVFLTLGSGFRKNFHRYTHPTRDPRAGELVTRDGLVVEEVVTGIARTGGSELAGATYFDGETNNTSMIWSNSLSAFWPATEKLGLGISYNLSHAWTYESIPLDEFSGVGARGGRGRRDSHGGTLFANYQALEQLSLGLGMATGGPTRTADDKRIRFPFFNFEGPESNMTTFFVSATYTESIPL